ncbi:hypothetical protein FQN60_018003 [Etheostoma spectabile]|uniref:Uncharacterized protein n=1 Tax=Etheostoma spectabile TaxID=54343 RepID=A0A5J5DGY5_9PERO|nr:hypothetical protein FQN60_018003 [Etheostoma spectabile]
MRGINLREMESVIWADCWVPKFSTAQRKAMLSPSHRWHYAFLQAACFYMPWEMGDTNKRHYLPNCEKCLFDKYTLGNMLLQVAAEMESESKRSGREGYRHRKRDDRSAGGIKIFFARAVEKRIKRDSERVEASAKLVFEFKTRQTPPNKPPAARWSERQSELWRNG